MHPTHDELRELMERGSQEEEMRRLLLHVRACPACIRSLQEMRSFDLLVRGAMHEKAPATLNQKILNRLGIEEAPPAAWRFVQYLAPVFALLIIAAIVAAAFWVTGKLNQPEIQSSLSMGKTAYDTVGTMVSSGAGAFSGWVRDYMPFAFAGQSLPLTIFLGMFFLAIGLLDKFVFMPMIRKRGVS